MTTRALRRTKITDHAVVRYMERKYGADFDIVRQEIWTPDLQTSVRKGKKQHIEDGIIFIIKEGKIVTCVPNY